MKSKIAFLALLFVSFMANAQDKKAASPAETATGTVNGAKITVNYGAPSVKGREIWGGLVPYGKVWRAGANDATTFETSQKITVEGKELPAGKYSFFIIPEKESATIVFNKEAKQWGAYDYDEKKDQLRVVVKPTAAKSKTEKLTYSINAKGLLIQWDSWDIPVAIK
ncbi:MAG: DUF2911 domain-containing protein [Flavobacterium sp.]|uniref:DUF2911 domain-containing protein n=1 Tax=Flavobacterium sp. TaxID=239 RepID=UPI0011F4EF8D|nr:DUF2911 domain-containing protein [Flavobacterium sp.]RZJ66149.1 MAG: DUF2911 domain-containing protein [Flavobacterium sp.]